MHRSRQRTAIRDVRTLLENGANPNTVYHHKTMLIDACYSGDHDSIDLILTYGGDPRYKDNLGKTPLHHLMKAGNVDEIGVNRIERLLEKMIRMGADLNDQDHMGKTPLITLASSASHMNVNNRRDVFEVVKRMVKHGADLSVRDNEGNSAQDYMPEEIEKLARRKEQDEYEKAGVFSNLDQRIIPEDVMKFLYTLAQLESKRKVDKEKRELMKMSPSIFQKGRKKNTRKNTRKSTRKNTRKSTRKNTRKVGCKSERKIKI